MRPLKVIQLFKVEYDGSEIADIIKKYVVPEDSPALIEMREYEDKMFEDYYFKGEINND